MVRPIADEIMVKLICILGGIVHLYNPSEKQFCKTIYEPLRYS